ncbi:MAG: DEAD/DEAH box helicase [Candidatus Woesearchaeota archaeon]|nr:DEAD/DEAH box helicase [Candidatus Woesearchaeota archaeon]
MIKDFVPRLYQETIFATASRKNTLVVLPTGMGKTNIFLMLAAHRLTQFPNSKILFIGPTRPLIDQYLSVFEKHFEIEKEKMAVFTGFVAPEKRAELWKNAKIIFSTPQGLENDVISSKIDLSEVSLLGVDEAHRAVGDYAYVFIAKMYNKLAKYPRILALTASPGSDLAKIEEVCKNLFIEEIEVRTNESEDVKPYIQEVKIDWVKVELPPPFKEVQKYLQHFLDERLKNLKKWGILRRTELRFVSKKDLIMLQGELRGRMLSGDKDFVVLTAISVLAEIMKIYHALELLETQGIITLHKYFEKLLEEEKAGKTKAIKNIVKDEDFKSALFKAQKLYDEQVEHPKLIELQKIVQKEVKDEAGIKIIVFNQYRDNAVDIAYKLNKIEGVKAKIFVGQLKKGDTGLTQKEQKKIMDEFRNDEFNLLISTSIGEEGLDVPSVNLVIFYEPIPSAIRTIQRKGRTGRLEKGKVVMLMTADTRDEAYRWSAHHKEKKMYKHLNNIKEKISFVLRQEKPLNNFVKMEKIRIYADYREKGSGVIKELVDLNVDLKLEKLETADYLLSSRCAVEFKNVEDFVNSIIDGRLLEQLKDLKQNYERPLVVVEGTEDIYSIRNVHANAIRGMLATIAVSYGIPILFTRNFKETALFLKMIAGREQEETGSDFSMHGSKKPLTLKEQQEYVVSSLPGIGSGLAKPLLKHFKTVKSIVNASEDDLQDVEKIGPEKAKKIREVADKEYEE